ncbi:DEAD/DEAH box helicase [Kocuria coralli]|uniref:DEAD/DEAH box helicase n=1 Tax=Kocuria coralli TaxID=1461025 RepID=A0A5J5L0N8_9MICC|nr:DEAD/DEAH box helicase [Kocuria coralli]KAA9395422.1 DEAD/DEAH box helicase [Kocuria coralli]
MADHPAGSGALERFSEPTRRWFEGAFSAPTAAQEGAWNAVADGRHTLVVAPTGSGKTLSAFLWGIDRLMNRESPSGGTKVLYISPLKALGVDVERNLRSPLIGITQTAKNMGLEPPELSTGVRSGDTPQAIRRALVASPPDILITTPESLYLMLTSRARTALEEVETIVLDEIHAVAGTKRGAHLALSLERLDDLLPRPAQRIGLSATVEPVETVTRFLGGREPVTVVRPRSEKRWDLTVSVPVPDMTVLGGPSASSSLDSSPFGDAAVEDEPANVASIWPHVEERVADLVEAHRSTIVFANSRGLAEKLTARLNEIHAFRVEHSGDARASEDRSGRAETVGAVLDSMGLDAMSRGSAGVDDAPSRQTGRYDGAAPVLARAHHGSVSKDQRTLIEEDLKSGQLRCVVATSSLELGIDMGLVDLVVQIESPPSAASGLQRVGRAGHQVGEVSIGKLFPKHRGDLLDAAVTVEQMLEGRVEALHIPANPLDVLAQQSVAACALEPIGVEDWWDTVRRSAPFLGLPRSAFDAVLDLVSGRYPSDEFAQLRPRVVWDRDEGTLTARPGAQRLAVTSGGTIPDRGLFPVHIAGQADDKAPKRVGELDEEMVYESRTGDIIALGASSWRIEEITHDRVTVVPAPGQAGKLPFWHGDGLGRPVELGRAQGAFLREIAGAEPAVVGDRLTADGLDEWARDNLQTYVSEMKEDVGHVPSDRTLIIERFPDELGDWRVVLHSPFGLQVHAPWALAVGARIEERWGLDGAAQASDDGIVLRIPLTDEDPPGAEIFLFDADELEQVVTEQVGSSALFASRFRECAARALLLPRRDPGRRTPLWQQRQRSAQLLDVARRYPQFPIVLETVRECLQDVYDLPALQELHREISRRTIRVVETTREGPSAFARTLLFGYLGQFIYEGDSPLAERKAAILSLDTDLLAELLGRAQLRELLDAHVISRTEAELQYLAPARRLRGREGLADLLRLLGPLTVEEAALRLRDPDAPEAGAPGDVPGEAPSAESGPELGVDAGIGPSADPSADPGVVERWADDLVRDNRAFPVRLAGEQKLAAVEDAARLRDALGAPVPHGVPVAFLDPVADPLGDLVGRYARTHGPFTVAEAAAGTGLGVAVVRATLEHLATERRVLEGEFRPAGTAMPAAGEHGEDGEHGTTAAPAAEWCEKEVLHRIRRRSLAALREQVEPVPPEVYARFLPSWQYVGREARLRGADGLLTVIDQLGGLALPASALEPLILRARIDDYSPDLLDEQLAAGEVLWSGSGSLSGDDGWLALHLAESQELTLPPLAELKAKAAAVTDALQSAILEILADGAARFSHQLVTALADRGHPADIPRVTTALWELVWAGLITNDTFAPVRALVTGGGGAHKQKPRAPVTRSAGRRGAARLRPRQPATAAGGPRSSVALQSSGRWSLLVPDSLDATMRASAGAELLLDRYGVLTRGAVEAEDLPGGFSGIYRVLTAIEDAGQTRRGYFIEGLGAAQFAQSSTVDRLRGFADDEQARTKPREPQVLALAATDPASPWGATLSWPPVITTENGTGHRPGRKAGAVVVSVDGSPVLYFERGGRTVLVFDDDPARIRMCAPAVVDLVHAGAAEKLTVEKVNGHGVLGSGPLESTVRDALVTAGFSTTPKGLRMRRGV